MTPEPAMPHIHLSTVWQMLTESLRLGVRPIDEMLMHR